MKKIKLTQGKEVIIDDEDFEYLNQWKWYFSNTGYAVRKPKTGIIQMHRLINKTPEGLFTDHINRNSLDNRKCNLRTVTKAQNQHNQGLYKTNTSGFKGISWDKSRDIWSTKITLNNRTINLGRYQNIKDAIKARSRAERVYYAI